MLVERPIARVLSAVVASAALAACTATVTGDKPGQGQTITVEVVPADAHLAPGEQLQFTAVVTGTADTAVSWEVLTLGGGTIDATGLYTAPATAGSYLIQGTNKKNPNSRGKGRIIVSSSPVTVSIAPSAGATSACQSLTFTATVTGLPDGSVSWSVQEGAAGGTVTAGGVYTAPSAAGTYHLIATSQADPTSSATVPVDVTVKVLGVVVSPSQITTPPGGSALFTATVTTTCGTSTATQVVSAN
jgi:hypothetical protein